jgi:processive 1,2-diacylglycerol beta-glucosyltransferase
MTKTDARAFVRSEAHGLDLVVVHSPVGGGHRSAALAIAEAARARGLGVEVLDTFEHAPRFLGQAYVTAHLAWTGVAPDLYGAAYFHANHRDGPFEPVRRAADHLAWAGLVKRVVALHPRAVIATHHLPLLVLGRARRREKIACPLIGVVTDYGTHAVWAEKGLDALCVPGERARRDARAHRFPAALLHTTGIPVRPVFEAAGVLRDPAPGEALRVLVTSGGFGVGPLGEIVRSFSGVPDIELTVVCGRAGGLEQRTARLAAKAGVQARVLGFERDMAARMAEAHVVVGKAGGLTVSEAMTSGRPMILAGAVPGNEGINAEVVVSAGAGVLAHAAEVGTVAAAMRSRGLFAAMGEKARALVMTGAAGRVVDVAMDQARRVSARDAA